MSSTPQSHIAQCTHERRPGTTVCLLCRQEARLAASDRRQKLILRGTAALIVVAVLVAGVSSAINSRLRAAAKGASTSEAPAKATVDTTRTPPADSIVPQGNTGAVAPNVAPASPTSPTVPSPAVPSTTKPVVATPMAPAITPVVRMGLTELGDGVTATRTDSAVIVAFDTPEFRTRTPEKFERFLRWTLARVYGAPIETQLAAIPLGGLVAQGNLLYELPTRGIHVPVDAASHLEIYPEIRPGEDAPLVVRYRASVVRN